MVQYGVYSREFIAVARFGRTPLRLASQDPEALITRMREAEEQAGRPRSRRHPAATGLAARAGRPAVTGVTPAGRMTLAVLRRHWGRDFVFSEADGKCTARARSGEHGLLTADTPGELLRVIQAVLPSVSVRERSST